MVIYNDTIMGTKRRFISDLADKHIKRSNLIIRSTILIMAVIVLYDSYVFRTPLYFVLFALVGAIVGKLFFFSHKVQVNKENLELSLATNRGSIALLFLLIVLRFILKRKAVYDKHYQKNILADTNKFTFMAAIIYINQSEK